MGNNKNKKQRIDFWKRVHEKLSETGMTMRAFSIRSDVPYGTIYRQMSEDMVPPRHNQIEKMAKALCCSVEYLLTGKNEASEKKGCESAQIDAADEMNRFMKNYNLLTNGQRKAIDQLMDEFIKVNIEYSRVYVNMQEFPK